MSTQSNARSWIAADATVRDIRSAPGYAARSVGIEAVGAARTATSAGWSGGSAAIPVAASAEPTESERSFVDRLHDRKMVQWMLAYFGFAWFAIEFSGELTEAWEWSSLVRQAVSIVLALGVVPALAVAWYHGEKGRQRVCTAECALVAASLVGAVIVVWSFCRGAAL
jgi:hypothetical protein